MEVTAETQLWAEENFAAVHLGDRRRTRRLVHSAAKIAAHPEKSFTEVLDWNELRGFYGLCNQSTATLAAIQGPHWEQTRQAMRQQSVVLILHDTTELDFTTHAALQGAGPIGNGDGQGFLQHNSLAVVPQPRQVLGLAFQQWRVRQPAPKGETSYQRNRRKQRESQMWLEGIRASGPAPEACGWVDVGDRGSDIYEAMRESREHEHHFLFRAQHDRLVFTAPEYDRQDHLFAYARSLPSQGSDAVDIPGRGGRPARTALVQLAAAAVWIPASWGTPQRWSQPILPAWVVRLWEPHPPACIQEPLEWILLCSLPTRTLEELKERRDWYGCRWMVEVYHDIEKNGCSEEDRRFETAAGMQACVAMLALVAVRVFQLRCALEMQPEAPAQQVATATELHMVRRFVKHKGRRFTVRDFVRGVAKLGGFLGRKRDGEPGVRALWRGYQRLQDMLLGFHLHASSANKSRSRCW
jgi:Transposase DNA-binding/Transposase Tn5 dimerisation domain